MAVKKTDKIGEIVRKYPKAAAVMFESGLQCIGCPVAQMETIEEGARSHGMSDEDINKMIEKINKAIENDKD